MSKGSVTDLARAFREDPKSPFMYISEKVSQDLAVACLKDRCVDCGRRLHGHGIRCRECADEGELDQS